MPNKMAEEDEGEEGKSVTTVAAGECRGMERCDELFNKYEAIVC